MPNRFLATFLGRIRRARPPVRASAINWDLTYACPLRCGHCYSESGRRAGRQLPFEQLVALADRILAERPVPAVTFTGGEPILVKGFLELAERLKRGGARLNLYTSGFRLGESTAARIASSFDRVGLSVDGPDPSINDFIRERAGSFEEAMRAAAMFDELSAGGAAGYRWGFEVTVMKTNWSTLDRFVTEILPKFPNMAYLHLGALIPTGLASRETFASRELLDDDQMAELPFLEKRLRRMAPRRVDIRVFSNLPFLMHPQQIRRGFALDHLLKLEADGRVRGMDIYEGTVGSLFEEPLSVLFRRTVERHHDPFVVRELSRVRTMRDWAAACRAIDLHFASDEDRARIEARGPAPNVPDELRALIQSRPGARRRTLDLFV